MISHDLSKTHKLGGIGWESGSILCNKRYRKTSKPPWLQNIQELETKEWYIYLTLERKPTQRGFWWLQAAQTIILHNASYYSYKKTNNWIICISVSAGLWILG